VYWNLDEYSEAKGSFLAEYYGYSEYSPARQASTASLYPMVEDVREVSRHVALAVGLEAQQSCVAERTSREELGRRITAQMWIPHYPRLKYKAQALK